MHILLSLTYILIKTNNVYYCLSPSIVNQTDKVYVL
jgi:hypothetical protein